MIDFENDWLIDWLMGFLLLFSLSLLSFLSFDDSPSLVLYSVVFFTLGNNNKNQPDPKRQLPYSPPTGASANGGVGVGATWKILIGTVTIASHLLLVVGHYCSFHYYLHWECFIFCHVKDLYNGKEYYVIIILMWWSLQNEKHQVPIMTKVKSSTCNAVPYYSIKIF